MANEFGELVKAKLIERSWSQSELARRINKTKSYITYVVTGINPNSRRRIFQPGPDVVADIARELEIPVEEAFAAAGMPVPPPVEMPVGRQSRQAAPAPSAVDTKNPMFDIAYKAAVRALKNSPAPGLPEGIKIGLPGKLHVILFDATLTDKEISRYRQAFLATYDSVSRRIAEDRRASVAEARTE